MNNYHRIIKAVESTVWAIEETKLDAICELMRLKAAGTDIEFRPPPERDPEPYRISLEAADQSLSAKNGQPQTVPASAIAVLPIFGVISNRANMMSAYSGGTSLQQFQKSF